MDQKGYPEVDEHTFPDLANGIWRRRAADEEAILSASPDNPVELPGGVVTTDPRLDRIPEFDERSKNFPMAAVLENPEEFFGPERRVGAGADPVPKQYKDRSYTWGIETRFDQGSQPSCVGHAWGQELVARPVAIRGITQPFCFWLYKTAQRYDAWAGENYAGTSTIAGAKVLQQRPPRMNEGRGLMDEYRWIFGNMRELIRTLGYFGPVVAGSWWTTGMFNADREGRIRPTGADAGGHCYLLRGVSMTKRAVLITNSWGNDWGQGGDAWMTFDDFERLINRQGELCVPVRRQQWTTG